MKSDWEPTPTLRRLQHRAEILDTIRQFFKARQVLEVDTPLLSHSTVTDPYIESFTTHYQADDGKLQTLYLQTSPEFAMKRLLAAGSGAIYQITHAFRNKGETGRWHNPEFTLLEWYRPDVSLRQLMDETEALLQLILKCPTAQKMSYRQLFEEYVNLNPHEATFEQISRSLTELGILVEWRGTANERDTVLQLITDHLVSHSIQRDRPLFLYDFPASQAALARIRFGTPSVAERCEVYFKGLELANGFHELADPVEQKARFLKDLAMRERQQLPSVPMDKNLIAALKAGLPDCCGIALGIDRLIALATKSHALAEVITFPMTRA